MPAPSTPPATALSQSGRRLESGGQTGQASRRHGSPIDQSRWSTGSTASSSSRRYGPVASALPVSPTHILLSPGSVSSDTRAITPVNSSRSLQALTFGNGANAGTTLEEGNEADDDLHDPDEKAGLSNGRGTMLTSRGLVNIGCLFILLLCLLGLFAAYPIAYYLTTQRGGTTGGYNLGGINATGQVPLIENFASPIDQDTPKAVYSRTGFDNQKYDLVFSDEFNKEGRTFYPGDDPFWTAVDLHYWPTGDYEWYDPSAVTTRNGSLVITMTQEPINGLDLKSGMLQSWNQLCFQYSVYIEVSVSLPGSPTVSGLWPGVWMMGNLGRPGYGATTDGTWPYSYDSCDLGTLKNQTNTAGTGPAAALLSDQDRALSYLHGQRLSSCTCKGEDHPGPDNSFGRGAPEIDVIEAEVNITAGHGAVSQSAQIAPFDADYYSFNTSSDMIIHDASKVHFNAYRGGVYQQAISAQADVPLGSYERSLKGFSTFGFEYWADPTKRDEGYIHWMVAGEQSWTLRASAMRANPATEVSRRLISEEPMAMVINLGSAESFQLVDWAHLSFPAQMMVDYIRVYQRPEGRMGCDPSDRPTADYIARHSNAYNNPNLTTWQDAGNVFPRNRLVDSCN